MKNRFYYITFLFLLSLLTSCEDEIPYVGPQQDPVLVVHCEAGVGDTVLQCYVCRSAFFLEKIDSMSQLIVRDAQVSISRNGSDWQSVPYLPSKETRWTSSALYSMPLSSPLQSGDRLTLRVERQGYPTVESAIRVMKAPTIRYASCDTDSLGAVVRLVLDRYTLDSAYMGIAVHMAADYRFDEDYSYRAPSREDYFSQTIFSSFHPLFASLPNPYTTEQGYESSSELFFLPSDQLATDTITLRVYNYSGPHFGGALYLTGIWVEVNAHSEDSYQYLRSLRAYRGDDITYDDLDLGALIYDLIGLGQQEQIPVYSNIQSGLGIFRATSSDSREFTYE